MVLQVLSIAVEEDVKQYLYDLAKKHDRTASYIARDVIEKWVAEHQKKNGIKKAIKSDKVIDGKITTTVKKTGKKLTFPIKKR